MVRALQCLNYCVPNWDLFLSPRQEEYLKYDQIFPSRLMTSSSDLTVEFLNSLFEDYSKRGLTKKSDRCVAMAGLEARIAGALKCESRYGTFQKYLHRNLLWKASDSKVERIAYNTRHVPSWSWMAYHGGIQFMDIDPAKAGWVDSLWFDKECEHALITDVAEFRDCTSQLDGEDYVVLDNSGVERGRIQYDVEDGEELYKERCVVVGISRAFSEQDSVLCYILIVRPTGVDAEFKRVGIGSIQTDYIVRWRLNVRLV
jgi:hypothetical protein